MASIFNLNLSSSGTISFKDSLQLVKFNITSWKIFMNKLGSGGFYINIVKAAFYKDVTQTIPSKRNLKAVLRLTRQGFCLHRSDLM